MLSPSALTALLEAAGFEDVAIQVRSAPAYFVPCSDARFPTWVMHTRVAKRSGESEPRQACCGVCIPLDNHT